MKIKRSTLHDAPFLLLAGGLLVVPFLKKIEFFYETSAINLVDDVLLLGVVPLALTGLRTLLFQVRHGRVFTGAFMMYLASGAISTATNGGNVQASAVQLVLEMKFAIILLAALGLRSSLSAISLYRIAGLALVPLSLLLSIWQFASPESYNVAFATGGHRGVVFIGGAVLNRAAGFFWFPGEAAYFASIMLGLFWFSRRSLVDLIVAAMAGVVLLMTFSRQEIASLLFAGALVYLVVMRTRGDATLLAFALIGVALIGVLYEPLLGPFFRDVVEQLGIGDPYGSRVARVVFYEHGFDLAREHFPLGTGLGSFGGYAAFIYDSPVYAERGFSGYWWYRAGVQMTDTFWPHVLGESGVLGLASYLIAIAALVLAAIRRLELSLMCADEDSIYAAKLCLFGLAMLFSVSITSANMTTAFSLVLGLGFSRVLADKCYRAPRTVGRLAGTSPTMR